VQSDTEIIKKKSSRTRAAFQPLLPARCQSSKLNNPAGSVTLKLALHRRHDNNLSHITSLVIGQNNTPLPPKKNCSEFYILTANGKDEKIFIILGN
jgi:hypothetical protein